MARLRVLGENPPPPRGSGENQLRELRDYITRLKDELEFLLTHLGEDNLDTDLTACVKQIRTSAGDISDIEGEISDINTALAGKQNTLTFDDSPTSGSDNPVKSGGVYTELLKTPKYKQYVLGDAQTITHTFSDSCQFVILTERIVILSAPQTDGLYFGYNSKTNASTNKIHTVYTPDADPPTFSQGLGTIAITTPVSSVRVTVIEFVSN